MPFTPKHIVITGAAGAIGGALAERFNHEYPGAILSLVDFNSPGLEQQRAKLTGGIFTYCVDLTDIEALPRFWSELNSNQPAADTLINSAGIMDITSLQGSDWKTGRKQLDINLTAPMRLMDLALPAMLEKKQGCIINLSSMAGNVPIRGCGYYGAAKAGIGMASEIARLELKSQGINVVTVYPGPVFSGLEAQARAQIQPGLVSRFIPTGKPDVIAKRILKAFTHNQARVIYPDVYGAANKIANLDLTNELMNLLSPQPKH